MLKIWTLCFSIVIAGLPLSAQTPPIGKQADQLQRAENAIRALKNGVLIVSIPSNDNKITHLKKLVATTGGAQKVRFESLLQATIDETKKTAIEIVSAVDSNYKFSPVLYIYDTAVIDLKRGVFSGIFLDKSLKADPSISLNGRSYLVLKQNPFEDNWLVTDTALEVLQSPFPYKTPGRRILIFRLSMRFTARYLNARLNEYFISLEQ